MPAERNNTKLVFQSELGPGERGILFYYLLYRSTVIPRGLSLWGLITVFPCLVGTLLAVFGYEAPFIIYVPYVPFELVIGIWILVKGIPDAPEIKRSPVLVGEMG